MPITHGAKLAKNTPTCARRSGLRSTAFPRSSIPCTWNTFFAKSIPTVVIFMLDATIHLSGHQHFHFGTLMPFRVGAPIPLLWGASVGGLIDGLCPTAGGHDG